MGNFIALVTGANKGIGRDIARQLASAGLTVYVGSREATRGGRAVEEIGGDTRLLVLDVTDDASIAEAARHIARYKLPKDVVFCERMQRSPSGKADYRWAKAQVAEGL